MTCCDRTLPVGIGKGPQRRGYQVYGALFVGGNIGYLSHIIGGAIGAAFGFALAGDSKA